MGVSIEHMPWVSPTVSAINSRYGLSPGKYTVTNLRDFKGGELSKKSDGCGIDYVYYSIYIKFKKNVSCKIEGILNIEKTGELEDRLFETRLIFASCVIPGTWHRLKT